MSRFENISGFFTLENIIPALDKVQKRKRARLLNGSIIRYFCNLLIHDINKDIESFEIFAGYVPEIKLRMDHYDRTYLYYHNYTRRGLIIRQNSSPSFSGKNPLFAIKLKTGNVSLIDTDQYPVFFYSHYESTYFNKKGDICLSCKSKSESFFNSSSMVILDI
jgi:hypothetical protein